MKIWVCIIVVIFMIPVPATGAVIYFSDFESDDGGLVPTLDWEWGVYSWGSGTGCDIDWPAAPASSPYSGSHMWGPVLNDCYSNIGNEDSSSSTGCTNTNPLDDSILTLTVDLSGVPDAELSWWEWYDVNSYWDWGEVYVNGTVVFQHCESSYTAPSSWVQQTIDLYSFIGTVATIEFHFMASDVVPRAGWYIDDLEISTTGPTSTPTATPSGTPPTWTPSPTPEPVPATGGPGLLCIALAFCFVLLAGFTRVSQPSVRQS